MVGQIQTMEPTPPTQLRDAHPFSILNTPMVHVCQAALTHTEMNGITDHISVILLALADTLMLWKRLALTPANLNTFALKMISFIVKVVQIIPMELTALIPRLDAFHLATIDIRMAPVYNHVAIHTKCLGEMIQVSVMPLALADTLILSKRPVLTPANQNIFALKMISCIVKVIQIRQTELTALILPLDALLFGTSSTLMVHAYQAALILTEMNGMMVPISVILLALKDTGVV